MMRTATHIKVRYFAFVFFDIYNIWGLCSGATCNWYRKAKRKTGPSVQKLRVRQNLT